MLKLIINTFIINTFIITMEDKIITFLSKIFTSQNLENAKEQTNSWYASIQNTLNQKEKETFLLIFVKTLRLLYQIELNVSSK